MFVSVTVVPFDTRVEDSLTYEWKQGASHAFERVMNGGTDFNAPTKWVNDKGFDGHIILTDMMAPKPIASKCEVNVGNYPGLLALPALPDQRAHYCGR